MSLIEVSCELRYQVTAPSSFVFNVAPARTPHQTLRHESLNLVPEDCRYRLAELDEGSSRLIRLQAQPGELILGYRATVALTPALSDPPAVAETEHPELPDAVLTYLNPSRYCESDRLVNFARRQFGDQSAGFSRVEAVCDWVHSYLEYVAGTTDASTGACDVLVQRTGVCRDYAHLAIALCRALGIPARYVSGYAVALEPPDFHGFFEAYLNQRWYLFDATRMAPTQGLVRIGTGRDAADASFATIIGAASMTQLSVAARELTDDIAGPPGNEPAVSTA